MVHRFGVSHTRAYPHHGSGPWTHRKLWRDRSALARASLNHHLADPARLHDGPAVLGTVKASLRLVAEEATSLDSSCARLLDGLFRAEQELASGLRTRGPLASGVAPMITSRHCASSCERASA